MSKFKIGAALFLLFTLVWGIHPGTCAEKTPPAHVKKKILTSRMKIINIKKQIQTKKQKLYYVNLKEQDLSRQLGETQDNLYITRNSLNQLNIKISQLNCQIAILERDIAMLKKQVKRQKGAMANRLRDIYENGQVDYMACILDSATFSDFLNRSDFFSQLVRADCNMIEETNRKADELNQREQQLHGKKAEVAQLQGKYQQEDRYLASLESKRQGLLSDVKYEHRQISQSIVYLEHLTRQEEARLQSIILSYQGSHHTEYRALGAFGWPVNGCITSPFGYRYHPIYGSYRMHTGIDLGVGYGTTIAAACTGTVIFAGWYGGYGNAIVLDHGGGYSTLYGHCSALYVRQGQSVTRGQGIAAVGSTGNSTGPHLHFEVRYRGNPVNPLGKLP